MVISLWEQKSKIKMSLKYSNKSIIYVMKKFINIVDLEKEVSCRCVKIISEFRGHITQLTMRACYKLV